MNRVKSKRARAYKRTSHAFQVHKAAYFDPVLSAHIKKRTRFDAMISLWMLDFGPYLAHKVFEAPLIYLQVIQDDTVFNCNLI